MPALGYKQTPEHIAQRTKSRMEHYVPRPLDERFWEKVEPEPISGCFIWTGARHRFGYGSFGIGRTSERAHRVSWRLAYGPIPDGLDVLHRCDQPWCVNPQHLFLGTARDNSHDARRKGRLWQQSVTHCPQGHSYDAANTRLHDGERYCKECVRAASRRWHHAVRKHQPGWWYRPNRIRRVANG